MILSSTAITYFKAAKELSFQRFCFSFVSVVLENTMHKAFIALTVALFDYCANHIKKQSLRRRG